MQIDTLTRSLIPKTSTHVFIYLSKIEKQGDYNQIVPLFVYPYVSEMIFKHLENQTPCFQDFAQYKNKPFVFMNQEMVWHSLPFACPLDHPYPNWMISILFLPQSEEAVKCSYPVSPYLFVLKEIIRENILSGKYPLNTEDIEEQFEELKEFILEFLNHGEEPR